MSLIEYPLLIINVTIVLLIQNQQLIIRSVYDDKYLLLVMNIYVIT